MKKFDIIHLDWFGRSGVTKDQKTIQEIRDP